MKNQVTNQTELQSQFFAMPSKAIVTEIVFNNGESAKQITAIPKGVLVDHVKIGIIQALSMQSNIISCTNDVYCNREGNLEMTMSFGSHFFSAENRIKSPVKQEYVYTSINYLN